MRTEAGAPSPIWLEQAAAEELAGVCTEILGNARNELYLSMRFLDVALKLSRTLPRIRRSGDWGLTAPPCFSRWSPWRPCIKKNRILVNRTYLHRSAPLSVLPSVEPEKAGQGVLGPGL